MKKIKKFIICLVVFSLVLSACTPKSKEDADKLTADVVDSTQEFSEKVVEGLGDVLNNVKDDVSDIAGSIKDNLMDNLGDLASDVKDSVSNDIKNAVDDNLKDNISDALDNIKDASGDVINDIVEGVKNISGEEIKNVVETVKDYITYTFRNDGLLEQHFKKHGIEMGFDSMESYEKAASDVINNVKALVKTEKEDGDWVYYIEATNEFVVLSVDGFIRTYFKPDQGKKYFDKQ